MSKYKIELLAFQALHFTENTIIIRNLKKPLFILKPMSWSCKKCTFLNSPSSKSACQVCLTPASPLHASSSKETPKWSCKACTFLNIYKNPSCEICGTRAPVSSFEDLTDTGFDEELDSSVGLFFFPVKTSKRKSRDFVDDGDQGRVESSGFRGIKSCNMGSNVEG